jgi:thioredoxin reductase (NADPH)
MNTSRLDKSDGNDRPIGASPYEVDCLVVGGGAAGLSAAVNMGRMRRSVLLVDERDRFRWTHEINNYLGFPDGVAASQIRRLGWRHAARYGTRLMLGHASSAAPEGDRFRVTIERMPGDATGRDAEMARLFEEVPPGPPFVVLARCLILATGVVGHFPEFPGRDDCVGRSLFWCIHCDGYESIGKTVGVVGHDEEAAQTALDLLDFTDRVTLVAGRPEGFDLPESRLADLAANGIAAHPRAVAEYRNKKGQMQALVLDDPGRTMIPVEHVYTIRRSVAPTPLARQLGVALNEIGQIEVTSEQHTNVPGVYAAGDATSLHDHQISAAVHEGNQAACGANYHLYRAVQRDPNSDEC